MTVLEQARKDIVAMLIKAGLENVQLSAINPPLKPEHGDLSFPLFSHLRAHKQNESPEIFTRTLQENLHPRGYIKDFKIVGPYLNFFLNREKVAKAVLSLRGVRLGRMTKQSRRDRPAPTIVGARDDILRGQRVMIEYISPNNNKPLHLGHLRNAFLGESVARLLESQGAKVIRACLFNDRGLHIAKSMVAYTKWGKGKTPKSAGVKGDKFIGDLYVQFEKNKGEAYTVNQKRADYNVSDQDAEELVIKWEAGDKTTRALWKKLNSWAMAGFKDSLKRLKIKFNKSYFESQLWEKGKELVAKGLEQGIFKRDAEGCVVADLEAFNLPPKVMIRSNGTAIYSTTDLALGKEKFEKNKLTQAIWCVGSEQELYLKQLFSIYKIFGFPWFEKCRHLSYGLVFLPEGKMKSREGKVVEADDLLDELRDLALKEIIKRHPPLKARGGGGGVMEKRAEIIAQAALRFYLLSVTPKTIVHFNPQESISFTGHTGPYLLYTYARIASILRKAPSPYSSPLRGEGWGEGKVTITDSEWQLIMSLVRFTEVVGESAKQSDPAHLAQYLYDLTKNFSEFYEKMPVLQAEPKIRQARLALVGAVKNILSEGLRLLTIETVEVM